MVETRYKGWEIEVQSFESDGGQWLPGAIVSVSSGGSVRTVRLPAPPDVAFNTEQDADQYAVALAQRWVDERG
jgi:hypothetical protein